MKLIAGTAASILLTSCVASDTVGYNDGVAPDAKPNSEPSKEGPMVLQTLTLASGLVVDVQGPQSAIEVLPTTPSSADLCENFSLSITTTFDSGHVPLKYAATAVSNQFAEPAMNPAALAHLAALWQSLFPESDVDSWSVLGGFAINPFSVFPVQLTSASTPYFLGVSHLQTEITDSAYQARAPLAVFSYDDQGSHYAYPSVWQDAASPTSAPNVQVWSRVMDPENLLACPGYSEAMETLMDLPHIEDLATCGDIMAVVYSLPETDAIMGNGAACLPSPAGFGVTLSPLLRNDWQALDCPRPASASDAYTCFTHSAL
tara:strand:+ start:335 stop:1285 length:951 start_codon:yes stop_codon:yes gene_type:complete